MRYYYTNNEIALVFLFGFLTGFAFVCIVLAIDEIRSTKKVKKVRVIQPRVIDAEFVDLPRKPITRKSLPENPSQALVRRNPNLRRR